MTLTTTLNAIPLVTAGFLLALCLACVLTDALDALAWLEVFGETS